MTLTSKVHALVDGLNINEHVDLYINFSEVASTRMVLSKHPLKFKTKYINNEKLRVTRIANAELPHAEFVKEQLKMITGDEWYKVDLGGRTVAAFRNVMPNGMYATRVRNGELYVARSQESYRDKVMKQVLGMAECETRILNTLGSDIGVFRATLPIGQYSVRDMGNGKVKVTLLPQMAESEYRQWLTDQMMSEDIVELMPFKHLKTHVEAVCEDNGIRVKWLSKTTIRVYKAAKKTAELAPGEVVMFADNEKNDVLAVLHGIGVEHFIVKHHQALDLWEITRKHE